VSNLGLAGSVAGLLGALGAIYSIFVQSRGQDHAGRLGDERLGHDELVAALESQRERIGDLEARAARAEREERECNRKVMDLERKVLNLLYRVENRPE
jgi:hypothetical protein